MTVVLFLGFVCAIPSVAQAQARILASLDHPMCMRPAGDSTGDVGVDGIASDCSGNSVLWSFDRNGLKSDGWLLNHLTGSASKALTYLGGYDVGLRAHDPTDPNQLWLPMFGVRSGGINYFVLYSPQAGLCIKAPSGPPFNKTTLVMNNLNACPSPWSAAAGSDLFTSALFKGSGPTNAGDFTYWNNFSYQRGAANDYAHYFADVNGDGRADWIQVSRTVDNGAVALATPTGDFQQWSSPANRGAVNNYAHYFADVNGDGRADWIQVSRTADHGWVGLATPAGDFQHWTNYSNDRGAVNSFEHYFADVNGDKRADWIQVSRTTNQGWVGLATPAGDFEHWTNYSSNRGAVNNYAHYFADVNGDGRADWIQVARAFNDGWVGLATPAGDFEHWTNSSSHRGAVKAYEHYFADVNGDGRADWIQVARESNDGWVALGSVNGDFQHWTNHSTQRGAVKDYAHYFADVNGDGKADWIQVSRTTSNGWVGLATPSGDFQHWTSHSTEGGAGGYFAHFFADVNGDKRADWITVNRTANGGWVGLAQH